MLRRSLLRRCANESANGQKMFADPGGYGMKLEDAYRTFGFSFGDKIEKTIVKERFNKLAKERHPDAGGSNEEFLKLKEAHKIMMSHSHDPKTTGGKSEKPRTVNVKKMRQSDILHNVTWENAEEHRKIDSIDMLYGGIIIVGFFTSYYCWINRNILRASDGRSRMSVEEIRPMEEEKFAKPKHSWHPWKSSNEVKDMVTQVEAERLERLHSGRVPA